MKHKVITTEQGKIIVDETTEIKPNDYYVAWEDNYKIPQWIIYVLISGLNGKTPYKIIGTINHSINKNIAMVIVEDEVKILGYKASQQKDVYSEEDLRKVAQGAELTYVTDEGKDILITKFIESLKQEYIELEMETSYLDWKKGDKEKLSDTLQIRTARVDGQLMAYIKQ
jgi:hypothetical protein